MDCVFCRIIAGELPGSVVHRDARCIAFLDIRPFHPGHLLVVPLAHASGLAELDPEDGAHVFRVAQQLASTLKASEAVRCEGVNLLLADGAVAGQEVFHVHLHVLPRFPGDTFRFRPGPLGPPPTRAELDALAAALR